MKKTPKAVKAWAVYEDGKLACYDHRIPVFWLRKIAKDEGNHMGGKLSKVVEVLITPLKKKWKV